MESVMDFLAEYYIWFFVVAGILCFALIGFIIDARKKKKNEFKGESVNETQPVVQNATDNTVANITPSAVPSEPQVVGNTVNVGGEATLGTPNTNMETTMEINDIPMATTPNSNETKVEFYSGPVEMPTAQPAPVPQVTSSPVVQPTGQMEGTTIGEPISINPTSTVSSVPQTDSSVQNNTNNINNNIQ